jgi:COMPASS component SWD2
LRCYKIFRDNTSRINNMDYSHDGKYLITSSDDDSMIVYDCDKATKIQTVFFEVIHLCISFRSTARSMEYA